MILALSPRECNRGRNTTRAKKLTPAGRTPAAAAASLAT